MMQVRPESLQFLVKICVTSHEAIWWWFLRKERKKKKFGIFSRVKDIFIDGIERSIQRPKDKERY